MAVNSTLHDDFLLGTRTARSLYHEVAAPLPIIDYHCHLDPGDLAADRRFGNLAQLWVTGDPYKHRAMRIAGQPERVITGGASEREKFDAWASTVPRTIGNPLHHWTTLELKRIFDIGEPLTAASADRIWSAANARLAEPGFSARGLLARRNVAVVCTSDRLLDDLSCHLSMAGSTAGMRVLPSLRADDVVAVNSPDFAGWLRALGAATGMKIADYGSFCAAVIRRMDVFARAGCRLSDHGLDDFRYAAVSEADVEGLFARRLSEGELSPAEIVRLRSGLLRFLGNEYGRRGWIMQVHLGAQRRTSSRLRAIAGPAGGYAGIGSPCDLPSVIGWLDDLESTGALPRTLLYPLNPADFAPLAVLSGSFAREGSAGHVQLGPAWWFNDHAAGIRAHLEAVANYGLLAAFIGMTTDSRSLVSMVRHEYFRRVACGWLGEQVERGAMPSDTESLQALVNAICHDNAHQAFLPPKLP